MFSWLRKRASAAPPSAVLRDLRGDGWHIQLDLTPQVLSLAIPEETNWQEGEEELAPTWDGQPGGFVSASMLAVKAKLFDDGLYAAVELAAQPRKVKLLSTLAHAAPEIAAAARLGGLDTPLSAEAQTIMDAFLDDELACKPLGFYTWSEGLGRIFRQDRLLQRKLEPPTVAALTAALDAVPATKAAYGKHLDFVAKLTNPFPVDMPDLRHPGGCCFFPPSQSHESELMARLYRDVPIPEGFSLADEMVKRLRDGSLKLATTDRSGWYDFQTWALEPLVLPDHMPEGARLKMNDRYRRQLDDLFKAILSLSRETHVKQLEVLTCGSVLGRREEVVRVVPELTVEPVRTYYERRAHGYDFIRGVLESAGLLNTLHRLSATGPVRRSLEEELAEMTALFRGAAAVAGHELGMHAATGPEAGLFREWAKSPGSAEDVRMMVPVFFDLERRKTKVWAILGWARRLLQVSFATPPTAQVIEGQPQIKFDGTSRQIAYPVFAETYVNRLLDRDEFRAHCDLYRTRGQILQHL